MACDISVYEHRLGIESARFSRIEHEDAIVAEVYKVTAASGVSYVLKICSKTRHYDHESYFLRHFAGIIPVPHIVGRVPPETNLSGAILMEYLPGELLSTQNISEGLAFEIGVTLAKVHAERMPEYGDIVDGRQYVDARLYVAEKFEEAFGECQKHFSAELREKCRSYYDTHVALLDRCDGPCLTHRDFRPANIIVHNGTLQGIIDWSSSRAGFAEEDFIPFASGEWHMSSEAREAFLNGYATIRPVPNYATIMPFLAFIRACFTIGYAIKRNSWQTNGARAYASSLQTIQSIVL